MNYLNVFFPDDELIAEEGDFSTKTRWMIPRTNVAKFMLDAAATDAWNKKLVSIGLIKN